MVSTPTSSHAFFKSIPWTSSLLSPPNTITKPATSRTPKSTSEDSLIATTLLTPQTIPHCLIYYPAPSSSTSSSQTSSSHTSSSLRAISILFALGTALNGHPQILHGGITAVLMDESMGMLLQCQSSAGTFTKTLTVEYLAPVRTPGIVLVKVNVVERRGRGVKLVARLLQKEGGEETEGGMVECARGEGLFVTPRGVKL